MWPKRLRDYWAGVDDGADVSYRVAVAARTVREWLQAISLGHGITLVPRSTASLFRGEAVRFIPMPALAPSRICLARRAEDERPMLRNFVAVAHWLGCGASHAFGLEGASIIDQHDPVGACH
jgi:DNA-binding transcriptional LysR family regulator